MDPALEKAIEQAAEHVKQCQIGFHKVSISRTTIQDIVRQHIGPVVRELTNPANLDDGQLMMHGLCRLPELTPEERAAMHALGTGLVERLWNETGESTTEGATIMTAERLLKLRDTWENLSDDFEIVADAYLRELSTEAISAERLKADGITDCGSSTRVTGYCIAKGVWLWMSDGNWEFDAECFGVKIPISTMGHVRTLLRLASKGR